MPDLSPYLYHTVAQIVAYPDGNSNARQIFGPVGYAYASWQPWNLGGGGGSIRRKNKGKESPCRVKRGEMRTEDRQVVSGEKKDRQKPKRKEGRKDWHALLCLLLLICPKIYNLLVFLPPIRQTSPLPPPPPWRVFLWVDQDTPYQVIVQNSRLPFPEISISAGILHNLLVGLYRYGTFLEHFFTIWRQLRNIAQHVCCKHL